MKLKVQDNLYSYYEYGDRSQIIHFMCKGGCCDYAYE